MQRETEREELSALVKVHPWDGKGIEILGKVIH